MDWIIVIWGMVVIGLGVGLEVANESKYALAYTLFTFGFAVLLILYLIGEII